MIPDKKLLILFRTAFLAEETLKTSILNTVRLIEAEKISDEVILASLRDKEGYGLSEMAAKI